MCVNYVLELTKISFIKSFHFCHMFLNMKSKESE